MGGTLHRDSFIGLECQKAVHNLVAGNLHKTGTAFVTLGENRPGFVQVCRSKNLKLPFNTLIFTGSLLIGKYT